MSHKYLKETIYYSKLYDRFTIEKCKCWEDRIGEIIENPKTEEDIKKQKEVLAHNFVITFGLRFVKGNRYLQKEETIRKWTYRDQTRDEKLENAIEPEYIRCSNCYSQDMTCISKDLMTDSNNEEEVLFMFQCDKCGRRRSYWENGTEWKSKLILCPKCSAEMSSSHIKKGDTIETTNACSNCQHKETNGMDLSVKEELADPNFEMKRKKYCLSEKEGKEFFSATINIERTANFLKKLKDEEENKEIYDAVDKMKKLTISELQNFLSPILEKAGYAKLEFEKPEIKKDVMVEFSLQDAKSGRGEYDSIHELQRLLKKTLETTNWRLTSNGVSYHLGFLQGRLRGVEGKENLRKLVGNDIIKKHNKEK